MERQITKNLLKGKTCESCKYAVWYLDKDHIKFAYGNSQFQDYHFSEDGWLAVCDEDAL